MTRVNGIGQFGAASVTGVVLCYIARGKLAVEGRFEEAQAIGRTAHTL